VLFKSSDVLYPDDEGSNLFRNVSRFGEEKELLVL